MAARTAVKGSLIAIAMQHPASKKACSREKTKVETRDARPDQSATSKTCSTIVRPTTLMRFTAELQVAVALPTH
jgi:hypothetical protein